MNIISYLAHWRTAASCEYGRSAVYCQSQCTKNKPKTKTPRDVGRLEQEDKNVFAAIYTQDYRVVYDASPIYCMYRYV